MSPHLSPFYMELYEKVNALGGLFNGHLHLDRAYTLNAHCSDKVPFNSVLSLQQKHGMIQTLHESADYAPENLRKRLDLATEVMIACGTKTADTVVDVTNDCIGLSGLQAVQALARDNKEKIDIRAAAYNPLGFRDDEPGRWTLFETAAKDADFIGALPEVDDIARYPERIGFEESLVRTLDVARGLGKFIHVHLDQKHQADECATETLLRVLDRDGGFSMPDGAPAVWAVHVISPSTYDEARFQRLIEGLKEHNVGVICCPSGALGMRQMRPLQSPTGNSIARVLDFLEAGVRVRLGSDNIADMLSPSTTANLYDEVFALTAALRFYDIGILAKLAADVPLTKDDRAFLTEHLQQERVQIDLALQN